MLRDTLSAFMHFTTYVLGKCPSDCIIPEPRCLGQSKTRLQGGMCVHVRGPGGSCDNAVPSVIKVVLKLTNES